MNRILFERSELRPDGSAVFGGERAMHVMSVLHGEVGQTLKTGVVGGMLGTSVIKLIDPVGTDAEGNPAWRITVDCTHGSHPLPPWCDMILAPPRPRVMKRLLPQLATLGVRRIFLVGAEKVEKAFWGAQLLKEPIYHPLLVDGLMQGAVATELPSINIRKNFSQWIEKGSFDLDFSGQNFRILAHPPTGTGPNGTGTGPNVMGTDPNGTGTGPNVMGTGPNGTGTGPNEMGTGPNRTEKVPIFAIGPEGGWTDREVALLEANGFVRCGLGPRILKTETATVALLSMFMARDASPMNRAG